MCFLQVRHPRRGFADLPFPGDSSRHSRSLERRVARYNATTLIMPRMSPAKTPSSVNRGPYGPDRPAHWPAISPNPTPTASETPNCEATASDCAVVSPGHLRPGDVEGERGPGDRE